MNAIIAQKLATVSRPRKPTFAPKTAATNPGTKTAEPVYSSTLLPLRGSECRRGRARARHPDGRVAREDRPRWSALFVCGCSPLGVRLLLFVLGDEQAAAPPPAEEPHQAWVFEEGGSTASRWTPLPRPTK